MPVCHTNWEQHRQSHLHIGFSSCTPNFTAFPPSPVWVARPTNSSPVAISWGEPYLCMGWPLLPPHLPNSLPQLLRGWPLLPPHLPNSGKQLFRGWPPHPCPTVVSSYSGVALHTLPHGGQQLFKGWPLLPPHSRPTVVSSYSGLLFPSHSSPFPDNFRCT